MMQGRGAGCLYRRAQARPGRRTRPLPAPVWLQVCRRTARNAPSRRPSLRRNRPPPIDWSGHTSGKRVRRATARTAPLRRCRRYMPTYLCSLSYQSWSSSWRPRPGTCAHRRSHCSADRSRWRRAAGRELRRPRSRCRRGCAHRGRSETIKAAHVKKGSRPLAQKCRGSRGGHLPRFQSQSADHCAQSTPEPAMAS